MEPTTVTPLPDNIISNKRFTKMVEARALHDKQGYLDAVVNICAENQFEYSEAVKLITPPLKSKIENEAIRLNRIKITRRENCLPI